MGLLQNGQWVQHWLPSQGSQAGDKAPDGGFRQHIGPGEASRYRPESGRYHLYVSYACPWAHRALIFRAIKGLTPHISITVLDPVIVDHGWQFKNPEPLNGHRYLYELYLQSNPQYEGRVSVPVLWDKKSSTIVNNESADIIRIFNTEFNPLTGNEEDFYPPALREDIDRINDRVLYDINSGVYRAGLATEQSVYKAEYTRVFEALDWLDERLSRQTWLVGDRITEADWRLFTTLLRFDPVYYGHFKLNRQRLTDFAHLPGYIKRLIRVPGVAETINIAHVKQHYYMSQRAINPTGIVPLGPNDDFLLTT